MGSATSVNVSFEYGTTTAYGNNTGSQAMTTPGPYSLDVANLLPGTTYHYRPKADAGVYGTGYGDDQSFTTLPGQGPELGMASSNNATDTTIDLVGNLASKGTASSVTVYFEYGLTTDYGNLSDKTTVSETGYNKGGFTITLTNLTRGTKYHFRAIADAGVFGKDYSSDMVFATTGSGVVAIPSVTTGDSDSVTATTANLHGNLTSLGSAFKVNVYFEYGTSTSYGNKTNPQSFADVDAFSETITGLQAGTLYHYRAVVRRRRT